MGGSNTVCKKYFPLPFSPLANPFLRTLFLPSANNSLLTLPSTR